MDTIKLLLVEDDDILTYMLKGTLELVGGYEIFTAVNGVEGLSLYNEIHPDIIVSDIEMTGMSGFEMVKKIRETDSSTPIIFASARKNPKDLIEGLNLGADNFIRKPYLPEELHILIKTLLERISGVGNEGAKEHYRYEFGTYQLDTQLRTLESKNGKHLSLTDREVSILKILLDKKGEVVRKDEILIPLWGDNNFYTARSLDVFMTKIRKHLKEDNTIDLQTIRGEGFRLIYK